MNLHASQISELDLAFEEEGDGYLESFADGMRAADEIFAEGPNVVLRALDAGYEPRRVLVRDDDYFLDALRALRAKAPEVPIRLASEERLELIIRKNNHRGMVAVFARKALPSTDELFQQSKRILAIEYTSDLGGPGMLIRSALALGFDAAVLGRECEDPFNRRSIRSSVGNIFALPVGHLSEDGPALADALGAAGFTIVRPVEHLAEGVTALEDLAELEDRRVAFLVDTRDFDRPVKEQGPADLYVSVRTRSGRGLSLASVSALVMRKLGRIERRLEA